MTERTLNRRAGARALIGIAAAALLSGFTLAACDDAGHKHTNKHGMAPSHVKVLKG